MIPDLAEQIDEAFLRAENWHKLSVLSPGSYETIPPLEPKHSSRGFSYLLYRLSIP